MKVGNCYLLMSVLNIYVFGMGFFVSPSTHYAIKSDDLQPKGQASAYEIASNFPLPHNCRIRVKFIRLAFSN